MTSSVAVVIPTYQMAWCLERAVTSCLVQTCPPQDIIIVDDCSLDDTPAVVQRLMAGCKTIRSYRLPRNVGHLQALVFGLQRSRSSWTALLDADDELTPDSIERRIHAAIGYHDRAGEWPQLVYGDLYWNAALEENRYRFKSLEGHNYSFLVRELSLCQTSTILLGADAIGVLDGLANPYNTDDEIVVAVGEQFAVLHSGAPVAIVHSHSSPTRMTNSAILRFAGVRQLVRHHRAAIVREHGWARLFLWRLRVARSFLEWQREWADERRQATAADGTSGLESRAYRLYSRIVGLAEKQLARILRARFEQMYF